MNFKHFLSHLTLVPWILAFSSGVNAIGSEDVQFGRDIQPLLTKYCAGCHNDAEKEAEFSVSSFQSILRGAEGHPVVVAGNVDKSKLAQVLRDSGEDHMPPRDEPQPNESEILMLERWIRDGANGPAKDLPMSLKLDVPDIAQAFDGALPVTAMAWLPKQSRTVMGIYGKVVLRSDEKRNEQQEIAQVLGKVSQLRISRDGRWLVVASGVTGLGGQITLIDLDALAVAKQWESNRDILYAAALTPDNRYVVAAGYDRQALLYDVENEKLVRTFEGHNGAIYDLDIDPSGQMLATASADETVKLWSLVTGERLDTLGQGEAEQYSVRFDPKGKYVAAAGADRRLRLWEIASKDKPTINPLLQSAFAHEESILAIDFHPKGDWIASAGEDKKVKRWSVPGLLPMGEVGETSDIPTAVVIDDAHDMLWVSAMDGKSSSFAWGGVSERKVVKGRAPLEWLLEKDPRWELAVQELEEIEGNDLPSKAQVLVIPGKIKGTVFSSDGKTNDEDWFAFDAQEGQPWIIQIAAAREGSPLDSRVEICDEKGNPVLRTRLQAVRETYFTFRGKSSDVVDDFRLHNWQEMELNEWLYSAGEVVRLWLYPRGPDSGFKVYPGEGNRYTYFDTTATSHALGEPAWIVRELAQGEDPIPNGLPVFPIFFENDDDSQRRFGKDSKIHFQAPATGRYLIRLRDARGQSGADYRYTLSVTPPRPDFHVTSNVNELNLALGSGGEFELTAVREDGYQGPIDIQFEGLPEGFTATQPLTIEAGQDRALGLIMSPTDNTKVPDEFDVKLIASAHIAGEKISRPIEKPIKVKKNASQRVRFSIVADGASSPANSTNPLVLRAGQTISAKVIAERGKFEGDIGFGTDDCGRNLPHGVIVDNIGLNGLLIPAGQNQQDMFLTAAPWLEPQERLFHLRAFIEGNPTTLPILLRIEK